MPDQVSVESSGATAPLVVFVGVAKHPQPVFLRLGESRLFFAVPLSQGRVLRFAVSRFHGFHHGGTRQMIRPYVGEVPAGLPDGRTAHRCIQAASHHELVSVVPQGKQLLGADLACQ